MSQSIEVDNDILKITPLGAGQEVGRSCILLQFKGKTIMLDCGIHPAYTGISSLPFFDTIDASTIDILLITHFHLDHCAALPHFLKETNFKGRVFMTHPTKSIYKLILLDFLKVSAISTEEQLYNEKDLLTSMDKIEGINTHQVIYHNGIKFWGYNAGHVLGAAMFMIEIAGIRILYTGDYCRREDRHLLAAEVPDIKPDVLIIEATYGVQTLAPVLQREKMFQEQVHTIIKRGGRCLIPVFALGRAQELLLILDEYWQSQPTLHSTPIYFASQLAKKCMDVYKRYIHTMNRRIQDAFQTSNPFDFKYIYDLRGMDAFEETGPCVVMASPGMLQNGLSREFFELWCSDPRNGVIVPGYSVDGTLAKHILTEPKTVDSMSGLKLNLNCSVSYISFSAHADFTETKSFIEELAPANVVLVHGERNEMERLRASLALQYTRPDGSMSMNIVAPKLCQVVEFEFHPEKLVKIVGNLATDIEEGKKISGLIVRKDFNYQAMALSDLSLYTPIASSSLVQRVAVPFNQSYEILRHFLALMFELGVETSSKVPVSFFSMTASAKSNLEKLLMNKIKTEEDEKSDSFKDKDRMIDIPTVFVGPINIYCLAVDHVLLEYKSSPFNDMVADSVIAVIVSIEANPHNLKILHRKCNHNAPAQINAPAPFHSVCKMLQETYGNEYVEIDNSNESIIVRLSTVDTNEDSILNTFAQIDATMKVSCDNGELKRRIQTSIDRLLLSTFPIRL